MQPSGKKTTKEKQPSRYRRPKPNLIHYDKEPTQNAMQPFNHGLFLNFSLNQIDHRTELGKSRLDLFSYNN